MSHDTQVKQETPERCVLCGHSDGLREPEGITGQRLPTWTDCELAVDESRATPLQKFIYEFEPGNNDKQWREGLSAALATVRREEREAAAFIAESHSATDCDGPDCGVVIAKAIRASASEKEGMNG